MLNYNHAYYFHAVASEGSISRAAEKLDVSQATVSEQVRLFERALSTPLFVRSSSGVKLTEDGRRVFAETTIMFQAAGRIEADAAGTHPFARLDVGVSVAASRSYATEFLMPLLSLPDVVPSIRSGHSNELLIELRDRRLDLVLSEDGASSSELEAVEVHRPRLVVIAPPGREEASLPIVTYLPGSPMRAAVEAWSRDDAARERTIAAETDDAAFAVEIVASGLALAVVPRTIARDAITRGRIVVLEVLPPSTIGLFAVTRRERIESTVRQAVELLMNYANQKLDPEA